MVFEVRTRADDSDKHASDVNALLYHKGKLYSGADDGKIMIWAEDLKKITEVRAHDATVYSLAASEDSLYSCSNDGTVKAWNLENLKSKGTILKEECEFWIVRFAGGVLYSSDDQGLVRVHNKGGEVTKLYSQLEQLKGLVIVDNVMYAVRDLDVVISEMTGEESTFAVRTTLMGRAPLCITGDKLCFSSRGGKDILVHEDSQELDYKQVAELKDAHGMVINALAGTDGILYSSGWDKVVKRWKIEDGAKLVDSCNADIVVNVLACGEKGEIYAGGSDGHIIRIDV